MKNILFVNTGEEWAGVENWHYRTARALKQRNYNIFVLTARNTPFYKKCKEANFNVKAIKHIGNATFINPLRIFRLVKYLKKKNIEAVFLCQSSHFKYGSIAASLADVDTIVYRRALAKPINNTFYNRFLLKNCITDFMSISRVTKKENLKNLPPGYPPSAKIKLIYNGVKKGNFINPEITSNIRKEFNIKKQELLLANIGRLCRQKGQKYLIEAAAKVAESFNNFKLLLIGGGNSKEYKKKVHELNLQDRIIFTGFRKDIASILKQIDFMVHTAIYEGCPSVILEAMMAGVPIVSTKAKTIHEFVKNGVNGYLAEDKNPEDIADKIIKMIKNPERQRLGDKGAEIAKKNYSFEKMIDKIENRILLKNQKE